VTVTRSQQALLVELTGKDISKESDTALYAEMVGAYQRDDEIALKSRMQSLLSRFPTSTYADNALFLAGRMAVDHNNFPEAIRYFGRVEKEYAKSDKAAPAKFAKAMTYKRMNLLPFAKRSLLEVRSKYPGSPESFRANSELKMFN
jgi:TolA-binding protein